MRTPRSRVLVTFSLAVSILGVVEAQRSTATTGRWDLAGKTFEATVTRIGDGDTLDAVPAGESQPVRIRLEGVDAPEQGEPFARDATALLRALVFDQRVRIRGRNVDRYGRLIARITHDGADASVQLVRAGLACHAYAYDAALAREEAQARTAGAGFWAPGAPQPACVTATAFSRRDTALEADPRRAPAAGSTPAATTRAAVPAPAPPRTTVISFRGNVESRVYHAPSCRNYTCRNCTQVFASEAEAQAAGFRPAGDCHKG